MSDIINCYHKKYSGGIGDFIKGSVYLYSRCVKYGLSIDMDWKYHPVGKFITSNCDAEYDTDYVLDIEDFRDRSINGSQTWQENMSGWIEHIIERVIEDKKYRPATISSWYSNTDNASVENKIEYIKNFSIGKNCKNILKSKINFSKEVDKLFAKQKLKEYGIIHFRLGDRHTLPEIEKKLDKYEKSIADNYNMRKLDHDYDYYYYLIKKQKRDNNIKNVLVMSDSNDFKKFIQEESSNKKDIRVLHLNSAHTSHQPGLLKYTDFEKNVSQKGYLHTALDLKCIINSSKNITYSCYNWGSGFVIWPSKLYDIPLDINVL